MMTVLLVIGTFSLFAASGLLIVSLKTNYWLNEKYGSAIGLYEICLQNGACQDIDTGTQPMDDVKTVRAMLIVGITFGLMSFVTSTIFLVTKIRLDKTLNRFPLMCLVFSCIAGLFGVIGVAFYGTKLWPVTDKYNLSDYHFGYSFALCIGGSFLVLVGGIFVKVGGKSEAHTNPETQQLTNSGVPSMSCRERIIIWLS